MPDNTPDTHTEADLRPEVVTNPPVQRSARTDPSMRDGDSGHGNPAEYIPDDESTDRDTGDATDARDASEEFGVLDAVPSNKAIPDAAVAEPGEPPDFGGEFRVEGGAANRPRREAGEANGQHEEPARGEAAERNLPIASYQRLTVRQVVAKLNDLSREEVEAIKAFEESHRRRKTLLGQLERRLHGQPDESDEKKPSRSHARRE